MTNDNIKLRALEPEDLELLYQIENDDNLWSVGATNVPYSRYVLCEYITQTRSDIYADRQLRLMIENAEGDVVGIADLTSFDPRHSRAEVGILIRPAYRRRGYARRALAALQQYAANVLHLHQLYAVIAADNQAAQSLFLQAEYAVAVSLKQWLRTSEGYQHALLMQKIL